MIVKLGQTRGWIERDMPREMKEIDLKMEEGTNYGSEIILQGAEK